MSYKTVRQIDTQTDRDADRGLIQTYMGLKSRMRLVLRFRLIDKHMPRETFKQTKIDTQTNRETDK